MEANKHYIGQRYFGARLIRESGLTTYDEAVRFATCTLTGKVYDAERSLVVLVIIPPAIVEVSQ